MIFLDKHSNFTSKLTCLNAHISMPFSEHCKTATALLTAHLRVGPSWPTSMRPMWTTERERGRTESSLTIGTGGPAIAPGLGSPELGIYI